jgi:hypothetical protein
MPINNDFGNPASFLPKESYDDVQPDYMRDDDSLIQSLQEVIQVLHHCQAIHSETVPVEVKLLQKTMWQGSVEVFQLQCHPTAHHCFAWLQDEGKFKRYVALLESRAVASPELAVRAVAAFGTPHDNSDLLHEFEMK